MPLQCQSDLMGVFSNGVLSIPVLNEHLVIPCVNICVTQPTRWIFTFFSFFSPSFLESILDSLEFSRIAQNEVTAPPTDGQGAVETPLHLRWRALPRLRCQKIPARWALYAHAKAFLEAVVTPPSFNTLHTSPFFLPLLHPFFPNSAFSQLCLFSSSTHFVRGCATCHSSGVICWQAGW